MPVPAIAFSVRPLHRIVPAVILLAAINLQPAQAAPFNTGDAGDTNAAMGPVVAVNYLYVSMNIDRSVGERCWQTLLSQRDQQIIDDNNKPFYVRNMMPLIGAVMGGAAGALLLSQIAAADTARTWMLPVIAGSGLGGYMAGPGGVTGAMIGGVAADKLGKHNQAITIAVAIVGAVAGKALWGMVFPPAVMPAPSTDPQGDIPIETFVRSNVCGPELLSSHDTSGYRVGYRFNETDYDVELPYDPGEALQLDATGKAVGPARLDF